MPHEPAMRAWLQKRRLVGLEIDDIIQETYARLVAMESVEGVRNPRTYAFQAAYSVLITHVRRSKVVAFQTVADIDILGAVADAPSPERQAIDRDELQQLAESIAALPARVREVFILRRVEDMPQREVARQLGLSESTVEKHLSRAFYLLTKRLTRSGKMEGGASKAHEDEKEDHGQADR